MRLKTIKKRNRLDYSKANATGFIIEPNAPVSRCPRCQQETREGLSVALGFTGPLNLSDDKMHECPDRIAEFNMKARGVIIP